MTCKEGMWGCLIITAVGSTMQHSCNTVKSVCRGSCMNSLPAPVAAVALVAYPLVFCSTLAKGGAEGLVRAHLCSPLHYPLPGCSRKPQGILPPLLLLLQVVCSCCLLWQISVTVMLHSIASCCCDQPLYLQTLTVIMYTSVFSC